jgi:hypothetical protein
MLDNNEWGISREDLTVQLLIDAQITGQQIDDRDFAKLERNAHDLMTRANEKYAELLKARGKFSATVRRLRSLKIINQVFPCFSSLENQMHHNKHPHADITLV